MRYPAATVAAAALGLAPLAAAAVRAEDLAAQARRLARAPWSAAEHRALLAKLERANSRFYDLLGRPGTRRKELLAAWKAATAGLSAFHQEIEQRLARMREREIDQGGDLEALQHSSAWREREAMALLALYHLSWLRYRGALLERNPGRRRRLLEQAVSGFTRFLLVEAVPRIYGESLYGRGLALRELGKTAKAIADLEAAAKLPADGGVARRARAALAEIRHRKGPAPPREDPFARLTRALARAGRGSRKAQREATELARYLAARGRAQQRRVDKALARAPRSSFVLSLAARLAAERGDCQGALSALEREKAVDSSAALHYPRALAAAARCFARAGKLREAAATYETLLHHYPHAAEAEQAAYERARMLGAGEGTQEHYEGALRSYLERFPKAEHAGEVLYLLAELERRKSGCATARAHYEQAATLGGPFGWRARYAAVACRAELAASAGPGSSKALAEQTLAELRAFISRALAAAHAGPGPRPQRPSSQRPGRRGLEELAARAALLGALVARAGGSGPESVLQSLQGFEQRFPTAGALFPRALSLRAEARMEAGDSAGAARDLDAYLAKRTPVAQRRALLARLGRSALDRAHDLAASQHERRLALKLARRAYGELVWGQARAPSWIALGEVYLALGRPSRALRAYRSALRREPGSVEALRGAAIAARRAGRAAAAERYLTQLAAQSEVGGTIWYEARIGLVEIEAARGKRAAACRLAHETLGRSRTASADALERRLRRIEHELCTRRGAAKDQKSTRKPWTSPVSFSRRRTRAPS